MTWPPITFPEPPTVVIARLALLEDYGFDDVGLSQRIPKEKPGQLP